MENSITSEKQRKTIQEAIQTELLKRGFHAPIISFKEIEGKRKGFEFSTEFFQTTPVIFKTIQISNFSTGITAHNDPKYPTIKQYKFYIQVSVSYNLFDGGRNSCNLFDVSGILVENSDIYDIIVS